MSFNLDPSLLQSLPTKTVIVTGGANGIGLEAIKQYHRNGANVVIADLANSRQQAEDAIAALGDPSRALFVPVNITIWEEVQQLFKLAIEKFGRIDIVIANAGIMESRKFFDFEVEENGDLRDDASGRVIDVNLKGTMNSMTKTPQLQRAILTMFSALRLAVFYMQNNTPDKNGSRGSVVLISSTSGYFGGTEVVSYISSKHGVIGLLRSSHAPVARLGVRVNCVAPFITPTHITAGYAAAWKAEGLPTNTPEDVAKGIVHMSLDTEMQGKSCLVSLTILKSWSFARFGN